MTEPFRILVVDDEEDMLVTLRDILEVAGCEVQVASSGREALERCREQTPAWILMDVVMPELDGRDTLQRIRRLAPRVPIVLMTADRGSDSARRAHEDEAVEVLTKPLDLEDLLRRVERERG